MKITKLGHCAMVIEEAGVRLLTDPGNFSVDAQESETGIDAVLITHEHGDHLHISSLKIILEKNPAASIVANSAVAVAIKKAGIDHTVTIVGDGQSTEIKGISIEGFGTKHAEIYSDMGQVENTGFIVAGRFYFPGDNYHDPKRPVDILALPVAGPWMKPKDAIDFALAVKPRIAFGVHDGMIVPGFRGYIGTLFAKFVPEMEYVHLQDGESREF